MRHIIIICIILLKYASSDESTNSQFSVHSNMKALPLTNDEKYHLRDEAKEMFYHAFNSYMDNAYPADELMPLSCRGRWREKEISRGDVDEALGNFSLTLVDSLDTLVVLGDLDEFENAVKLIIKDVTFDHDVVVSVFETNIRMVGGLISGHILAEHLNQMYGIMNWYRGELLGMAKDLAYRLLPAFNTTTSIPFPRVNLKYGMNSSKLQNSRDTCTACAGTIILEFASLSRLTGDPIFEDKARQVMDYLWSQRHRGSDLMGTVLNVHSGDWVRRDSGVGAGIDSYYEYLFKAYILLGDDIFLDRFNKHYSAVMKYVSQGPMLLDVHMHRPHTTSRNYMDSLLAFWPGLQVLKGDIKPAIETHEMLYQIIQKHNFLPEAFTTDFQVHWGQHPLRPEFLESTYLLYQATGDHYYLRVGEKVLKSLQKHAWVPCGYAAVKDVRTGAHEDRMDSFVLAETFKYLYLLFVDAADIPINLDEFVLTTEAHLMPLSLARLSNLTTVPLTDTQVTTDEPDVEYARSCPNAYYLFPGRHEYAEAIRKPLENFVSNICPSDKPLKRKLMASEFQAGNLGHLSLLRDMGITIMTLQDGRVQLLHTASNAKSKGDGEEGLLFIQEMIELSKLQQEQPENPPRAVSFVRPDNITVNDSNIMNIVAGPAQFGLELSGETKITGSIIVAVPLKGCGSLTNADQIKGRIVIMERGDCMFVEKARLIESMGASGGIVIDNTLGSTSENSPMFAMSGDGTDDVSIPLVFVFRGDAEPLLEAGRKDDPIIVTLSDFPEKDKESLKTGDFVIRATGPAVKSTIKKHQTNSICTDDIIKLTEEDSTQSFKRKLDSGLWDALDNFDAAESATDVLKASLGFVAAHIQLVKHKIPSKPDTIANTLQLLLIEKTAKNPSLLKELLTVHLQDLMNLLKQATPSEKDVEHSIQTLASEAFAKEVNLDDTLLQDLFQRQIPEGSETVPELLHDLSNSDNEEKKISVNENYIENEHDEL